MKILIAEDQPPAALFLRRILEKMGHQVQVAPDGEAAWRIVCQGETPILISDWTMPHVDGLELCRRIRTAGSDRYTYIILLTSRDRREDRLEGLSAGEYIDFDCFGFHSRPDRVGRRNEDPARTAGKERRQFLEIIGVVKDEEPARVGAALGERLANRMGGIGDALANLQP